MLSQGVCIKKIRTTYEILVTNPNMHDRHVSIKWQILFSLISPLNIWAFYRIQKLRRYVLYVMIPSLVLSGTLYGIAFYEMTVLDPLESDSTPQTSLPPNMVPIEPQVGKYDSVPYLPISIASSIGFSFLSVYLAVTWSRQWNAKLRS